MNAAKGLGAATKFGRQSRTRPARLHLVLRPYSGPVGSKLIPTVNKLQEIFAMTGSELDLPQLVVVGAQSSGKSSVLENLVGRDFLPRGSGIVTRRPLILQLVQTSGGAGASTSTSSGEEWGEFSHKHGVKYTKFEDIRAEIVAETEKVAGRNLGVVDRPILLKIFSPHVVNLTLVDLPGMARNPVGDQPHDIEARIVEMIRKYAEKPNAILLAVHAANQDVATSDAVKLANQVDPSHQRTVGVLTKLDLMDKGTDAMALLSGKEMPLVHGWVPVLSRSQQDIVSGKTIASALRDEKAWFENHPTYSSISSQSGTHHLALKCNRLLTSHIRRTLPDLKASIQAKIKSVKAELEMYGEPIPKDPAAAGPHLLNLIGKFALEFKSVMEGGGGSNLDSFSTKDLNGGARVRFILDENFASKLREIHPLTGLSTSDIRMAVRNAAGTKSALLVPDQAFEQLVKRQIALFRDPALETAELVYNELSHILATMPMNDLVRYRRLREKITEVTAKTLKTRLKEVNQLIEVMVGLEIGFINTSHPDFIGVDVIHSKDSENARLADARLAQASAASSSHGSGGGFFSWVFGGSSHDSTSPSGKKPSSSPSQISQTPSSASTSKYAEKRANLSLKLDENMSEHERTQVRTIVSLLDSYMKISQKSIQDTVIKVIMVKLVNDTREALQRELTAALYQPHLFPELLRESEDIDAKRVAARENLDRLRAAKRAIQEADEGLWEQL
jgi:replication fork clamp-binding protein CrfC